MGKKLFQKIISVFLSAAMCIGMLAPSPLPVQAGGKVENLIQNGDFEDGWNHWETYFNEPHSGTAEITQDFMASIKLDFFLNWYTEAGDQGPVDWSTQLVQKGIQAEAGKTYKLRFHAKSTVKRPIAVEIGAPSQGKEKEVFLLGQEDGLYEMEITPQSPTLDLAFLMGQFTDGQYPDYPYTAAEFEKHAMYFYGIELVESAYADSQKALPGIVGVKDGMEYQAPVSIRVNYKTGSYTLEVKKDGVAIPYQEGGKLKEDGSYEVSAADASDPSVAVVKRFRIKLALDFGKEWVVIANKATGKVMEAGGSEGSSLVQADYAGRAEQFFLLEEEGEYVKLRSMSGNYVVQPNGSRLVLAADNPDGGQRWAIDDTVAQGYVKFVNKESGLAIDVPDSSGTEGLGLVQSEKRPNTDEGQQSRDAQRWDIIRTIDARKAVEGGQADVSTPQAWASNAIVTPVEGRLSPAGPITVEFYPLEGASSYDIYFDGEKTSSITPNASGGDSYAVTKEGTVKVFEAAYSTQVSGHSLYLQANTGEKTETTHFYLSKKGVGWQTLHRTEGMGLSWYYCWSLDEAVGTDPNLEFVPMVWGNFGGEWLKDPQNRQYGTVLSFNEPDWSDQSNVPVTKEAAKAWAERYNQANNTNESPPVSLEEAWQDFMDSGLRVGSPATALAPPYCNGSITMNEIDGPDNWWFDFMDLMDSSPGWDYDFTAIHCYDAGCDASAFLKMVDDTYALNHKPIWITEFGVAEWNENKKWSGGNAAAREKVRAFMEEVIKGLEEREYVERYAWFPFSPEDEYGGASGIFDYSTGKLTELGALYKSLGMPKGYHPENPGGPDRPDGPGQPDGTNPPDGSSQPDGTKPPDGSDRPDGSQGTTTPEMELLKKLLEYYLAYAGGLNQADYTNKSWSAMIQAIEDAKEKEIRSQAELKKTLESLQNALASLDKKNESRAVRVKNVKLSPASVELGIGGKATLSAVIAPSDASNQDIIWISDNEEIAGIGADGIVTGISKGKTVVTAVTADGQKKAKCKVTVVDAHKQIVKVPVSKVTLNRKSAYIVKGKSLKLKAKMAPAGVVDTITWSSSKASVASVKNGKVTAKKSGTAKITAKSSNGKKASCTVHVVKKPVKAVSIQMAQQSVTMKKGKWALLRMVMKPAKATDLITWKSSNAAVAYVDAYGFVSAKKKGTATITAAAGRRKAKCKVKVE